MLTLLNTRGLIILTIVCLVAPAWGQGRTASDQSRFYEACEHYVSSYTPLYILNSDTLTVSRFNIVPDSLNQYLISCAKAKDFNLLKFAAAVVIRQNAEYHFRNHFDYLVTESTVQHNGFIVLILEAMGFSAIADYPTNLVAYTGDICGWISENKSKIKDYRFVERYKKRILSEMQRK